MDEIKDPVLRELVDRANDARKRHQERHRIGQYEEAEAINPPCPDPSKEELAEAMQRRLEWLVSHISGDTEASALISRAYDALDDGLLTECRNLADRARAILGL